MNYSFYEVYISALRAFSGMGFPYGADEDAAYIIAWLELNNMNGIELLVNSINKIDGKYNGKSTIKKNQLKVDLKKSSELMKGPGLIDYFSAIFEQEKKFEIFIDHCDLPLFFIPLLYKISNKILFSKLIYLDNENRETLCLIKNDSVKIGFTSNQELLKKNQIKIVMKNENNSLSFKKIKLNITRSSIQKNLSKSLKPKNKYWKIVDNIACRTYVPESSESRLKGAGGSNDND